MYERDGEWVMEGLGDHDPKRIKTVEELYEYVDTVGFLPLFRSHVDRFSLEELTGGVVGRRRGPVAMAGGSRGERSGGLRQVFQRESRIRVP